MSLGRRCLPAEFGNIWVDAQHKSHKFDYFYFEQLVGESR